MVKKRALVFDDDSTMRLQGVRHSALMSGTWLQNEVKGAAPFSSCSISEHMQGGFKICRPEGVRP